MVMEESDMELASESIPVPQIQEPVVDTVKRNNKPGVSRGKPRLRKKALHASILKQMEFYFSDANLNKDRYLSGLLKENPYVGLEVFTRFNKLRELTTDTNRIAKALQGSTMLKVSEDGTKVCRLTPIQKKEDIDQCTIYVQNLPPDADHDWLISIFSKYGSVEYVSIPRYRINRKIKGFAFVEFDKPSSAEECIKTFRKKKGVLPSYISPNELLSITTFDEPNKDAVVEVINSKTKIKLKDNENEKTFNEEVGNISRKGLRLKRLTTEEEETETKDNMCEMDTEDNISKQNSKKRKSLEKSVMDESDVKIKKKKKEAADQNITDQDEEKKISKSESEDKNNTLDNETDATDNNGKQKFKKRKYSSEKLFVPDESQEKDIKVKKKKKATDQNITYQQNEKEKVLKEESKDKDNTCDNDVAYNNDRQSSKKEIYALEKSLVADESDVKVKKRRKTVDRSTINQQDEKEMVPKEESEDKTNVYDDETDTAGNNGRQSLKKRKLVPEKSYIKDERNSKVTGNSIEKEIPNKNRNKVTEKKKRRLTINDIITIEDNGGEAVKKECQKSAINSNKNETTELEYSHEADDNDEASALLQIEKHSTSDFGARNSDIEETSDERKKKKNRKKRSKIQDNDICSKIGLQIMAKSDWKRLRNRYLDLQRYKMKQLKVHLRKAEVERDGIIKNGYHDKTGQTNTLHNKLKHENDNETLEEKSCGRVNYAPGIIVKIEMDEPCTDTQSFKMELKDNNSIKYVDVIADSCEAYIRCDTAEAAQTFAQQSYEGRHLTILEGDEEKLYWDKIAEDRMEKLSKKKRVKQRGRDKLLKRAEKELGKCIKFD
ncbi:PREDICTED: la-related protein 7 [Trachymyrmex cornetzi]|uniref:La-related protein 7 n=1 Tax=Trachymyrmex cornetzi TaxID=471704 RepID=A0A195DYC8_9HYME|nr:PREDICTED: la-related protein 7 [Trachymyrmex cornetzi]XP_018365656.1 PREDICTED: la-related protein 7 [Trachymyrmex cornetzi]XP_018365657.1 PREDICTED: la-related protein 7 [Trachymyrmex cornetzi]KYN17915.1 La-related protein 7 [Trachymyrmex cornetzi]